MRRSESRVGQKPKGKVSVVVEGRFVQSQYCERGTTKSSQKYSCWKGDLPCGDEIHRLDISSFVQLRFYFRNEIGLGDSDCTPIQFKVEKVAWKP
jgi:hypothetical protein